MNRLKLEQAILKVAACGSHKEPPKRVPAQRAQRAVEKGAALAKEAARDPDMRELAQGMAKEAGFWDSPVVQNAAGIAGGTLMATGAVAGATMGMKALERAYTSLTEGKHKARAMSDMLQVNKPLAGEDKKKVQQAFSSLWKWNPEAAKDPLMAGSFVTRVIDYGGVVADDVKKMVDTRKALREAEARESIVPELKVSPLGAMGQGSPGAAIMSSSLFNPGS